LLDALKRSKLDKEIIKFASSGKPIYGFCAGANVLGHDIGISGVYDENTVGLKDTRGLKLTNDYSIFTDYKTEYAKKIIHFINRNQTKILALEKNSCLYYNGQEFIKYSRGKVYKYKRPNQVNRSLGMS
jgi:peptidase E